MSSLREDRVRVPGLNTLKFLRWGMQEEWKEVGEWRGTARTRDSRVRPFEKVPRLPLYRVRS